MMLITVFGNKLNKRRFFFILGWGKFAFTAFSSFLCTCTLIYVCTFIGPAIPIVTISAITAHEQYGTDY